MHEPPQRWTPAQLQASLAATLADWNGRSPLWLFGYASLIWKPELAFEAREPARIFGYHRRLCLRSMRYRGTEACPGVVAGLDRGGSCAGLAYRIAAGEVEREFERLWEREMILGSYRPTWVRGRQLRDGAPLVALAFVVRNDAHNYCGGLPDAELLAILRQACGVYGSSLDYLRETVNALRALGLRDRHLERLLHLAADETTHGADPAQPMIV
jgi:glutathione-specific gamma-glutamylcyclotransferase